MDYKFFLSELKNIILDPSGAWESISSENDPSKLIRNSFLLPLALIVSLAAIAGSMFFSHAVSSPAFAVMTGIRSFIVLVTTVYLVSLILGEVTYPLDLGKDFSVSFTIVTLSFVPFLLCQILSNIFESLLFVNIIGLYGMYIFWEGAEKYLKPPKYKKMPLLIATMVTTLIVYVSTDFLFRTIFNRIYFMMFD